MNTITNNIYSNSNITKMQKIESNITSGGGGYNVYLLYQKEVFNTDHSYLQSMLDWLYTSVDSPYKFIIRNKCLAHLNPNCIHVQNTLLSINSSSAASNSSNSTLLATGVPEWHAITFNLKHLKEIYVDKRHKDTCVLVSRHNASSPATSNQSQRQQSSLINSNYVWKRSVIILIKRMFLFNF